MSDIASNTEPQKVGLPHVQNHRNIKYEASFSLMWITGPWLADMYATADLSETVIIFSGHFLMIA